MMLEALLLASLRRLLRLRLADEAADSALFESELAERDASFEL